MYRADHTGLFLMGGAVGAVKGRSGAARRTGLDAVKHDAFAGVVRRSGHCSRRASLSDPAFIGGGHVRARSSQIIGDADLGRQRERR